MRLFGILDSLCNTSPRVTLIPTSPAYFAHTHVTGGRSFSDEQAIHPVLVAPATRRWLF